MSELAIERLPGNFALDLDNSVTESVVLEGDEPSEERLVLIAMNIIYDNVTGIGDRQKFVRGFMCYWEVGLNKRNFSEKILCTKIIPLKEKPLKVL